MSTGVGRAKWFLVLLALAMASLTAGSAWAENEGWLGVMLQPLSEDIVAAMELEKGAAGVLVSDVVDGSPADQADIEKGDVIVEIDGAAITAVDQAVEQVRSHAAGDQVKLVILRDGKKRVATVTLGERGKMVESKRYGDAQRVYREKREPRRERWFEGSGDFKDLKVFGGGHIGIRIQDMTPDLSSYFRVGEREGVLITAVTEGSPAAKAGLRGGDVVIKVDGREIGGSADLAGAIRQHEPGDKVEITFKRKGETRRLGVEVGKGPGIYERFLGEAGAPGVYLWEGGGPGECKRKVIRVGEGFRERVGDCKRKCMEMMDKCHGMTGKEKEECRHKCMEMMDKCHGMMGKEMGGCRHEEMMKEKCHGMMGESSEGTPIRKRIIKMQDDDPVKRFMIESEVRADLEKQVEALRHEIESLKKEVQALRK